VYLLQDITMQHRYLTGTIRKDLAEKMVFLGGPRQVGKTTLATMIGKEFFHPYQYLNWDSFTDHKTILANTFQANATLLIFDELHKYRNWKNYIKGEYDKHKERYAILITGSARLDVYRKGGDSLQGRYHYYRLHPFSVAELYEKNSSIAPLQKLDFPDLDKDVHAEFETLLLFGGFPEPFLSGKARTLRRWQNQRTERLVREDIRDVQTMRDLSSMQVLVSLLPQRVGSLLSLNALREDLQISHKTIAHWMDILEQFYYQYRIYPFASTAIKSLRKEPKLYLWDWSEVMDEGARLENLVASHLLKFCHFLKDVEGYKTELRYLRDIEGREVDFLVTVDQKPWFAVEVKQSVPKKHVQLQYFGRKLAIPFLFTVVQTQGIDVLQDDVRIMSAEKFLGGLV